MQKLDLGYTSFFGIRRTYGINAQPEIPHMHCLGSSGSGKSRFLAKMFLSLYDAGIATTLIDPHGDLARLVLSHLVARGVYAPSNGDEPYRRILYLDLPGAERAGRFLPFNVFQQELPRHTIGDQFRDAMHRAFPELAQGAASFDTLLPDAVQVLIANNLRLTSLQRFFIDPEFRSGCLANFPDPTVTDFYTNVFDKLREIDQLNYAGSVIRRAKLLTGLPVLRHSLGASHNIFNYQRIMDDGHFVIINLNLREKSAADLLGCLILKAMEDSAIGRDDPSRPRTAHVGIVDESSNFVAKSEGSFTSMLSQTRKYKLSLVLAHQTWSQFDERLWGSLGNAGVKAMFRQDRSDAEVTAKLLGTPDPLHVKHQPPTEGNPAYYQLQEEFEAWTQAIMKLRRRQFFFRIPPHEPPAFLPGFIQEVYARSFLTHNVRRLKAFPMPNPIVDKDELARVEEEYLRYFWPPSDGQQYVDNLSIKAEPLLKGRAQVLA